MVFITTLHSFISLVVRIALRLRGVQSSQSGTGESTDTTLSLFGCLTQAARVSLGTQPRSPDLSLACVMRLIFASVKRISELGELDTSHFAARFHLCWLSFLEAVP